MIVDIYKYFQKFSTPNKLVGDDYLFVEYQCPLDVENFQLWIESHMIAYVINGKKDWITPEKTYELRPGNALFVRKGVHSTRQYFEDEYCVMLFIINDKFIKRFISENPGFARDRKSDKACDQALSIHTNETFQSLMASIFHYFKEGREIPRSLVELKFQELLFNIAMNPANSHIVDFFNGVCKSNKTEIEQIMMSNFQYDLKIEDFARLCGRSLSTFKRDFKLQFDTTPAKWLSTKRLEYARALLLGSDRTVNEVCYESGFKNPSHFVKSFKDAYDLPPNRYKKANLSV